MFLKRVNYGLTGYTAEVLLERRRCPFRRASLILGQGDTFFFASWRHLRFQSAVQPSTLVERIPTISALGKGGMASLQFSKNREIQIDDLVSIVTAKGKNVCVIEATAEARTRPEGSAADVSDCKNVDQVSQESLSTKATFRLAQTRSTRLAASRLASTLWLSGVYRSSGLLTAAQVVALCRWIMEHDGIEDLLCEKPNIFLEKLLRCADQEITTPKQDSIPPLPFQAAETLIITKKLSCIAKVASVNIAIATEVSRVQVKYIDHLTASCCATLAHIASSIRWLLNESKLQPRRDVDSAVDLLTASCCSLAAFSDAVQAAYAASRTDLKQFVKSSATRHHCSLNDVLLPTQAALYAGCCRVVQESFKRFYMLLLPRMRQRLTAPALGMLAWPQDVPRPTDLDDPAPFELDVKSAALLQDAVDDVAQNLLQITASGFSVSGAPEQDLKLSLIVDTVVRVLALELSLGVVLIDDERLQCYNAAVEKASKKKKNVATRLHIGHPLYSFILGLLPLLPPPSPNSRRALVLPQLLSGIGVLRFNAALDAALTVANQSGRRPKVAKGCLDVTPQQMLIRSTVLDTLRTVFRRYGAVPIDTPIFELKETLTGKYGEDQKLIFDLKDQGGEQLSLRYDLTVPFARYLATQNLEKLKRYHIGKVYRRDEPQMAHGRFREFYQCDFDIAGDYDAMVPDAEVLCCLVEILQALKGAVGHFEIKLSHRKLLDAIMEACGVPPGSFRPVCSAIDKLDKLSWEEVENELCNTKGLSTDTADKLRQFVQLRGSPQSIITKLESIPTLSVLPSAQEALRELKQLIDYLNVLNALFPLVLDLSLARGLDYYTGVIYEAVVPDCPWLGSVAAGGRYDNLVGMFGPKKVPCVGVSVGVERLFRLIETQFHLTPTCLSAEHTGKSCLKPLETSDNSRNVLPQTEVDVMVCSVGSGLLSVPLRIESRNRMEIAKKLRDQGVITEFIYNDKWKLGKQLQYASEAGIQLVVIIGDDEWKRDAVKLKQLEYHNASTGTQKDRAVEREVPIASLVDAVRDCLRERLPAAQRLSNAVLHSKSKKQ